MRTYSDETGKTIKAHNYQDAAEKLYGVAKDYNGRHATYVSRHNGYADVRVYAEGDKVGTYYGVQAATPTRHTLRRIIA